MKLTEDQIDQLYKFTRQHFVEWYDLQSELVDHLANAIEAKWEENPKLTFDEILHQEFKKFGIFGFMDVVEERQKFLGKKYGKIIWKCYRSFFKLPQIFLTLFAVFALYSISKAVQNVAIVYFSALVIILIVSGFQIYRINKAMNARQKATGKKWLFEEVAKGFNILPASILPAQMFNFFNFFGNEERWNQSYAIFGAFAIVLFALLLYVQWKVVQNKITEELARTYPEYEISR